MATIDAQFGTESTPIVLATELYWDDLSRGYGGPSKKHVVNATNNHPSIDWDLSAEDRNTWNIYRSYYSSGFRIAGEDNTYASIGDYIDGRYTDDETRVANEAFFQQEYLDDLFDFGVYGKSGTFLQWLEHRHRFGTVFYGNLPDYTKVKHVGYCWAPCPYSTQSSDERTRIMLELGPADALPTRNDHSSGDIIYYMKAYRRQAWGYQCTFETCPGKSGNIPYFYT